LIAPLVSGVAGISVTEGTSLDVAGKEEEAVA